MRILLTTVMLAMLLAACGHRTALTLPNGKGKPPPAASTDPTAEQQP